MGAYAALYGGIEERLTASEDLRANGAGPHAMWRFVDESAAAMRSRPCAASRRSCGCGGRCRARWPSAPSSPSWPAPRWWPAAPSPSAPRSCSSSTHCSSSGRWRTWSTSWRLVQKANGAMVRVIDLLAVEATVLDDGTTSPAAGPLVGRARPPVVRLRRRRSRCCTTSHLTLGRRPVDGHRRAHRQRQDHAVAPGAPARRGQRRRTAAGRRADRRHPVRASCGAGWR